LLRVVFPILTLFKRLQSSQNNERWLEGFTTKMLDSKHLETSFIIPGTIHLPD